MAIHNKVPWIKYITFAPMNHMTWCNYNLTVPTEVIDFAY